MPIYEYQCEECGDVEEALQKVSDPPLRQCSACGGGLHKLISQSSFHLKGSGWYVTDYANKSKPDAKAASPPKSKEKSPGAGSDSAPTKTSED